MHHHVRHCIVAGLLCAGATLLTNVGEAADVAVGSSGFAGATVFEQLGADIDGETPGDGSGRTVSVSADGNRVAIGAPANDGTGEHSGHVRVYDWDGNACFLGFVPERTFDSREIPNGAWGPDEASAIGNFPGFGGIRLGEADAVVLNVTVTQPTAPSYLTVFPSNLCDIPLASNLNFVAGQTVPNHVVVRLGTDSGCTEPDWLETIAVYNRNGNVHVVIDIFGMFTAATTTHFG